MCIQYIKKGVNQISNIVLLFVRFYRSDFKIKFRRNTLCQLNVRSRISSLWFLPSLDNELCVYIRSHLCRSAGEHFNKVNNVVGESGIGKSAQWDIGDDMSLADASMRLVHSA